MKKVNKNLQKAIEGKKAVIWDFDGVICFANWHHDNKFEQWWNKLWQLLEEFEPKIRSKFAKGLKYYYEHTDYIVKKYGKKALRKINRFYLEKEMLISSVSPMNDELVTLINKVDSNIEHYIWSNNQQAFIVKKLKEVGIFSRFKEIVSRDKLLLAKPNLDGFELIKAKTNTPAKDFIFVGDSHNTDELVAKELGIDFFLYK